MEVGATWCPMLGGSRLALPGSFKGMTTFNKGKCCKAFLHVLDMLKELQHMQVAVPPGYILETVEFMILPAHFEQVNEQLGQPLCILNVARYSSLAHHDHVRCFRSYLADAKLMQTVLD